MQILESIGRLLTRISGAGHECVESLIRKYGHPVYSIDLELPRGASRAIVLHLSEPVGTGTPIVLRQPLVRSLHVTPNDAVCR